MGLALALTVCILLTLMIHRVLRRHLIAAGILSVCISAIATGFIGVTWEVAVQRVPVDFGDGQFRVWAARYLHSGLCIGVFLGTVAVGITSMLRWVKNRDARSE